MEPGCETYPWIRALKQTDRPRYDDVCHQLRSDGRYREVELSNTLVTQQLWAEPNWLVVLGYSYYAGYRTELLGTMLDGTGAHAGHVERRHVSSCAAGLCLRANGSQHRCGLLAAGCWRTS